MDENVPWDELEVQEAEALPEEVLGWLLLRRAGLSTSSRLSVQASVGNSLRFDAIERALRDQEEELLAAERRPQMKGHGGKGQPPRRTFWVEENKEWGLLDFEPDQDEVPVHWIGSRLPDEVYRQVPPEVPAVPDDEPWWINYANDDGSWNSQTAWWSEPDTWQDYDFNPDEQKQLDEIYAAYEDKVRTFVQARALMKDKVNNRGFFLSFSQGQVREEGSREAERKRDTLNIFGYGCQLFLQSQW